MSRIGRKPIMIPSDITLTITDEKISVKGKHGALEQTYTNQVSFERKENELFVQRKNESKQSKSYHGLMRALVQNMIIGTTEKFTKTLIAEGIGYKFQIENSKLILNVGFTHPVEFAIPTEITIKAESATKITIAGINKEKVGLLASQIRAVRPPEPYKGKGIMYENERIIRKAGKTGK